MSRHDHIAQRQATRTVRLDSWDFGSSPRQSGGGLRLRFLRLHGRAARRTHCADCAVGPLDWACEKTWAPMQCDPSHPCLSHLPLSLFYRRPPPSPVTLCSPPSPSTSTSSFVLFALPRTARQRRASLLVPVLWRHTSLRSRASVRSFVRSLSLPAQLCTRPPLVAPHSVLMPEWGRDGHDPFRAP